MITSIKISGFRGIKEGELKELTPLTIIVGPNGSGKSSLLEALTITTSNNPDDAFLQITKNRPANLQPQDWLVHRSGRSTVRTGNIRVESNKGTFRDVAFTLNDVNESGIKKYQLNVKVDQVDAGGNIIVIFIYTFQRNSSELHGSSSFNDFANKPDFENAVVIDNRIDIDSAELTTLFSLTAEVGGMDALLHILRELVSDLQDVRILTNDGAPILHFVFKNYSVPAALAGNGIYSLLHLSLMLASQSGGLVLLEEPETHKHPGGIWQTSKAILAAVRQNTQVILTTHSLELIDALIAETKDDSELDMISVFRLLLEDGCLRTSRFDGHDALLMRSSIEEDLR